MSEYHKKLLSLVAGSKKKDTDFQKMEKVANSITPSVECSRSVKKNLLSKLQFPPRDMDDDYLIRIDEMIVDLISWLNGFSDKPNEPEEGLEHWFGLKIAKEIKNIA